jgi:hypothetical protein
VRLVRRWENKQFDGIHATFSRLKILLGERGRKYKLRISWYERSATGKFEAVSVLDHEATFTIGGHSYSRKRERKTQKKHTSPSNAATPSSDDSDPITSLPRKKQCMPSTVASPPLPPLSVQPEYIQYEFNVFHAQRIMEQLALLNASMNFHVNPLPYVPDEVVVAPGWYS